MRYIGLDHFFIYSLYIVCILMHTRGVSISVKPRRAVRYQTQNGQIPFDVWLKKLKDVVAKAKIITCIERAEKGLFKDWKKLDANVYEMRVNWGPGYRVYFAIHRDDIILLLLGGDKSTQDRDIEKAKNYWAMFKKSEDRK
jgi:putative addiction module killer protein